MLNLKKILAIAIIATFLASIPLAFAENKSDLVKVVYEIKIDANYAKPPGVPGGGKGSSAGYTLIAKGLYNVPVDLYYKPSDEDSIFYTAILNSITEYNSKAPKTLFSGNIIQDYSLVVETNPQDVDYRHELVFGDLGTTGTIAQITAWITRGSKIIVDFDIVFNTNYDWGNPGVTSNTKYSVTYMDTWSIVTHELGHGVGLGDLYQDQWYWQTMYGFADFGQTWKRTLESGDIAGLKALYG